MNSVAVMTEGVAGGARGWRQATETALYGPAGFFRRAEGPAGHFRTSVHVSPRYAGAVAELLRRVDQALDRPPELALVDVGAGRGELLTGVLTTLEPHGADADLTRRLRLYAVERAPEPSTTPPGVQWSRRLPQPGELCGLLFGNEWLDNVPVDVAEVDEAGVIRYVLVHPDGTEEHGAPVTGADAAWLARWWPLVEDSQPADGPTPGRRAEIGAPRDSAWRRAVRALRAGLAVAVDYAHERAARPRYGTLTGFREGREVRPVPDGCRDLTSHVALDACAAAGAAAWDGTSATSPTPTTLSQREALRALGLTARRPPLGQAGDDPVGYLRELAAVSESAELLDPAGLGGFRWLLQPVGDRCRTVLPGRPLGAVAD